MFYQVFSQVVIVGQEIYWGLSWCGDWAEGEVMPSHSLIEAPAVLWGVLKLGYPFGVVSSCGEGTRSLYTCVVQ